MFTPKELQEKTFDKAMFGGYDMQMVDEFLEPLTQDYITLYKENSVLKSKMKILVEKLEEYRAQELSMKKALMAAQQTSESIIAEAQKKAAGILNDAESSAQNKAGSLQQEYAAERERVERARTTAQDFIAAVEQDVRQHLELLEALKKLSAPLEAPSKPAQPAPEPPAPPARPEERAEADLAAQIGSAVQEIVAEEVTPGKARSVRFEDLQFGKDYSFSKS